VDITSADENNLLRYQAVL